MGLALHESIDTQLGNSLAADRMADGVDTVWWDEFTARSTGIERTFRPQIIGFAAVLSNLSAMADNAPPRGAIAALVIGYLSVWAFLVGGVIDRLARQRPLRGAGFFSACGHYVFRIARLGVAVGFAYWLLFDVVHRWLFDDLFRMLTRDLTVERNAFLLRMVLYALFGVLVVGVNLLFDYAKIRIVVEDRRSVLGAPPRGVAIRATTARGHARALPRQRRALCDRPGCVRGRRARRGRSRRGHVGGLPHRAGVYRRARLHQARLLRIRDGVFPERARARRVRGGARAAMARLACGRGHRTLVAAPGPRTFAIRRDRLDRMSETVDHLVAWMRQRVLTAGANGLVVGLSAGSTPRSSRVSLSSRHPVTRSRSCSQPQRSAGRA